MRKPRFKAEPGKASGGISIDGYLITPDALLPFAGVLRDDHGLTKAEWIYATEQVDIQLTKTAADGPMKDRTLLLLAQGDSHLRRTGLVVSGFSVHPLSLQPGPATSYWAFVSRTLDDLAKLRARPAPRSVPRWPPS